MTERDREMLSRVKARAKTIADACQHFKVPGEEPLTVISLLYLALKIQGQAADQLILQGPVQALIKIGEALHAQAEGRTSRGFESGDPEATVTLSQTELALLMHSKMGKS